MLISGKRFFVTGTDTGVGKTFMSVRLLEAANRAGLKTIGIKPVASGCVLQQNRLVNDDALKLQAAASIKLPYEHINPFAFEPAIAPHLASPTPLSVSCIVSALQPALSTPADWVLIEGAGGWLCPLNQHETLADVASALACEIILVVKMQLGCLNHALLTAEAITQRGLTLAGWIPNTIGTPMPYLDENIAFLTKRLGEPWLATTTKEYSNQTLCKLPGVSATDVALFWD